MRAGLLLSTFFLVLLTGCGRAPSFSILGSFFPGWIACIAAGSLLSVAFWALLTHLQWERYFKALPLVYLSVALACACSLWLLFFE